MLGIHVEQGGHHDRDELRAYGATGNGTLERRTMPVRPKGELELVRECLKLGVSVAKMALRHGIKANLLRKWITKSFDGSEIGAPPTGTVKVLQNADAFVAVRIEPSQLPTTAPTAAGLCQGQVRHLSEPALMRLQVRLPKGDARSW
jgi:transposase